MAWSVRTTFGLFYVALGNEFGWSRADAALGYSLSWLTLLVFAPVAGRLHDRFGARVVVPIGAVVLGVGLALTGDVRSLWQYGLVCGVLIGAGIVTTMTPASAVVSGWHVRERGTALAIIGAGSSLGAFMFFPVNLWLITRYGWRTAIAVYGLIVVLSVAPIAAVLYRREPRGEVSPEAPAPPSGVRHLFAIFVMWSLGTFGYQIMTTHQVAHALGHYVDPVTIAFVFGLAGVATAAGNLLGAALTDRWGREWVFTAGSALGVVGVASFAFLAGPRDTTSLLIYAIASIGFGMRISLFTAIRADLYQRRHFRRILGFANAGGALGGFVGPYLGGYLFDVTGDYRLSFAVAALATACSAAAAWLSVPRKATKPVVAPSYNRQP